jgi:hypothetical protein
MGILTNLISAAVKTAIMPIAVVQDAVDVTMGVDPKNTKELLESASKDVERAVDTLAGENNDGIL